jgi:ribosome recycling factor
MIDSIKTDAVDKMAKTIDSLKNSYLKIRTGRATPDMLDGITVDYYGTPTAINGVANISIPEARQVVIQPWEKSIISEIEKSIQSSNLGLTPQNDGNVIRLNIPALTEERRKELAKESKSVGEDAKVSLRNIRRDANDGLKKAEKAKEIAEDQMKDGLDEIQKLTDKYVKAIDDLISVKEKEIMTV